MKDYEYFVDGDKLALHVDTISEEKHIAQALQDNFNQLKRLTFNTVEVDSELYRKLQQLSDYIDGLVRFYTRLEEAMDDAAMDTKITVRKIETMLLENSQSTKQRVNGAILL